MSYRWIVSSLKKVPNANIVNSSGVMFVGWRSLQNMSLSCFGGERSVCFNIESGLEDPTAFLVRTWSQIQRILRFLPTYLVAGTIVLSYTILLILVVSIENEFRSVRIAFQFLLPFLEKSNNHQKLFVENLVVLLSLHQGLGQVRHMVQFTILPAALTQDGS